MKALYVDDIRTPPDGWTLARSSEEAINMIYQFRPQFVSVDHDIVDHPETNFTVVVKAIAMMDSHYQPMVACHSGNGESYDKYKAIMNGHLWSLEKLVEIAKMTPGTKIKFPPWSSI